MSRTVRRPDILDVWAHYNRNFSKSYGRLLTEVWYAENSVPYAIKRDKVSLWLTKNALYGETKSSGARGPNRFAKRQLSKECRAHLSREVFRWTCDHSYEVMSPGAMIHPSYGKQMRNW